MWQSPTPWPPPRALRGGGMFFVMPINLRAFARGFLTAAPAGGSLDSSRGCFRGRLGGRTDRSTIQFAGFVGGFHRCGRHRWRPYPFIISSLLFERTLKMSVPTSSQLTLHISCGRTDRSALQFGDKLMDAETFTCCIKVQHYVRKLRFKLIFGRPYLCNRSFRCSL